MVTKVVTWKADDGTLHDTKEAAEAHDQEAGYSLLVGMTAADVESIRTLKDEPRLKKLTQLFYDAQRARQKAGLVKRRGEKAAAPAQSPGV